MKAWAPSTHSTPVTCWDRSSRQVSSRSRRSGRLLLHAALGLLPRLQRAREERLPAAKAERIPIDCARFREVDKVKHALRVEV